MLLTPSNNQRRSINTIFLVSEYWRKTLWWHLGCQQSISKHTSGISLAPVNLILDLYGDPSKKQVQHLLQCVSKQTLKVPALLKFIPKFPLFPAAVDDKALENSSQEPDAQSSLIFSLIREPFLKLKHTNTTLWIFQNL